MEHLKTILLVEDDGIIALRGQRLLEKEGYRVILAHDGEQAAELIRARAQPIDLVLMDVNLGSGMDGPQTARQILFERDIPIVFLSSYTEKEIVAKTEAVPSYGYVVKESDPTVLFASVKMAFKLHDAHLRLRQSESRYRQLLEGLPDVVYTYSNKRGGIYYSSQVEKLFGYSANEFYANPFLWNESIHPDDFPQIIRAIAAFEHGTPFDLEYRIHDRQGRWHWLRDRSIGRRVEADEVIIEGLATDITENKQMRDRLVESEERFRVLFEHAPDAIFLADPRTGLILDVNQSASRLTMRSRDELLGLHQTQLHPPTIEAKARATFDAHINESQLIGPTQPIESAVLRADGLHIPVEVVAQILRLNDHEALMGIFRDITGRKQVKQLLSEKELLLKEVHHRIKNNMNTIASLLHLQADRQTDFSAQAALRDAASRVQSMMTLYDQLYRVENFSQVSMRDYLTVLLNDIVALFPNHDCITLETDIEDIPLSPRFISPLGIILNELATNAMKHAFPARAAGKIRVSAARQAETIIVRFCDDGVGLPESFNLEAPTGFGLSLVSMLIRQIHASISIEKEGGTCFVIQFLPG